MGWLVVTKNDHKKVLLGKLKMHVLWREGLENHLCKNIINLLGPSTSHSTP